MHDARTRAGADAAGDKTLVEFVYRRLKSDIVYGTLKPGTKLRVEGLRAQHGVSSSTMREALLMLVGESLATAEGQRGFRVAPLSLADFREVTDLRKLMETMALRESIARGDDDWEAGVVAAFRLLSQVNLRKMRQSEAVHREYQVRNDAFHEALVAASPSQWVQRFRRILYQQAERYRAQHLVHANVRPGVRKEHQAIMEAALARDADRACRLTEEHIERTYSKVAALFAEGKTDFSA